MKNTICVLTVMSLPMTAFFEQECKTSVHIVPAIIEFSKKGNLLKVQHLIRSGADVNVRDKSNLTALMWASKKGHVEIVRLLIDYGADINARADWTALIWAAASGNKEIVSLLLENGADVNAVNPSGCTALMFAAFLGEPEIAKILIENGAVLNTRSKLGVTALMMAKQKMAAKRKRRLEVARMITNAGAQNESEDE